MTASQVIDKIITNKDLKAVLTAQFADYGCSPAKISFAMHCGVVNHYLEGGYYPRGVKQYSRENYSSNRKKWRESISKKSCKICFSGK